jgi:hypothetical protein
MQAKTVSDILIGLAALSIAIVIGALLASLLL